MSETPAEKARRVQLRIITEKAALGDHEAKRLREERGVQAARIYTQMAARDMGLCDCTRTDGIVCGRRLTERAGHLCWPCWGRQQDRKPCDHALARKRRGD